MTVRPSSLFVLLTLVALSSSACGYDGGWPAERGADAGEVAATTSSGSAVSAPARARPRLAGGSILDARVVPATVGLDSALLARGLAEAAALPRLHNLIVARHGAVVAERHVRGPAPDAPANIKSASKSVLSALVGIAIAEGHLAGPDQAVAGLFPDYLPEPVEPERAAITLGDLLSMRAGLESTSGRNYGRWVTSRNWVREAITRPMVAAPGGRMIYSTGSTHLLSAILTRATGVSTLAFARSRLGEPLDIRVHAWPTDPQGIYFGGNDMRLSPRDLLRFGELYRAGGAHEGRQVVPRDWIEESWGVYGHSRWNGHGYGYGWWSRTSNGLPVRFAWGYGGQFLFIVPSLELTGVFTSDPAAPREGPHNRAIHDIVDRWLVPAALAGG